MEGRSEQIKSAIGSACIDLLKQYFADSMTAHNLQLTVEIRDIRLADYSKYPEGTLTQQ